MKPRGLRFYFRIYRHIVAQDIKSKMSYRADFIISLIGMIATNIANLIAFWLIFQTFPSLNGWNYHEMLFMYGFTLIALTPMQCLFDNNWNLRSYVYSGDFIKYCFRPINLFFYYMSEVFDVKGLGQLAMGIFAVVYSWNVLGLELTALSVLLFIVAALTASLFMIALMNLGAAASFYVLNSGYIMVTLFKFTDYAKYPVTIYNTFFRIIFTFVIPIAFISYYPSQLFLRPDAVPVLTWLSPIFAAAFFFLSYKVWMKGAMNYNGTGS